MIKYFTNKIFIFLVIVVSLLIACFSNISAATNALQKILNKSRWQLQNRLPTTELLLGISFINAKRGWAGGSNGIILQTVDGGKNWVVKAILPDEIILKLHFFDSKTGIALCYEGSVFRTLDGGGSWSQILRKSKEYNLNAIQTIEEKNIIIISGYINDEEGISPIVLSSNDRGNIWVEKKFKNFPFSQYCWRFNDAVTCFIDERNIIVGDRQQVFLSNDKGITWKRVYEFSHPYPFHSLSIFFKDNKQGFIFADDIFLTTSDGGLTWKKSIVGHPGNNIRKISFADQKNGIAVGFNRNELDSVLLKTVDGGKSWRKIDEFENIYALHNAIFVDNMNGWISGSGGTILHTKDGGKTWKSQTKGFPQSFKDGFFIDKLNGWVIGGEYQQRNIIINTNDGGNTWNRQYENTEISLNSIIFSDRNCGWVTGDKGLLLHTNNGGIDWNKKNINTEEDLINIDFINKKTGWISGDKNIYKTEDGGYKWVKVHYCEEYLSNSHRYFYFFNKKRWWIVGSESGYETKNEGLTWKKIEVPDNPFFFLKSGKGWKCIGDFQSPYYKVYFTDNFGENWIQIGVIPTNNLIADIFFLNPKIGFIIFTGSSLPYYGSNIYKTTDGGKTWIHQNSGTRNLLKKIIFVDPDNGWILGDFGTILHTTTGGE